MRCKHTLLSDVQEMTKSQQIEKDMVEAMSDVSSLQSCGGGFEEL